MRGVLRYLGEMLSDLMLKLILRSFWELSSVIKVKCFPTWCWNWSFEVYERCRPLFRWNIFRLDAKIDPPEFTRNITFDDTPEASSCAGAHESCLVFTDTTPSLSRQLGVSFSAGLSSKCCDLFDCRVVSSLEELCANMYRCEWKELFMPGVLSMLKFGPGTQKEFVTEL